MIYLHNSVSGAVWVVCAFMFQHKTFNSIGYSRPVRVRNCLACSANCLLCKWSIERFSISYSFIHSTHNNNKSSFRCGLSACSPAPNNQHSHYFSSSYLNNHFNHFVHVLYGYLYHIIIIFFVQIKVQFLWFHFLLPFFLYE